jgi:alkanesulfonate monooxygenase SsuD/methylene tetrahydromethanopterin reductase-like flavin-dependent oxidoreductase (luciferase family)
VLVGAGGTEKTFAWIARSADGWITTPIETGIEAKVDLLRQTWKDAGRDGEPEVVVLATGRPDPEALDRWAALGVTEVMWGVPDTDEAGVVAYLGRLAAKLGR